MLRSFCTQLAHRNGQRRSYAGLELAKLEEEYFRLRAVTAQNVPRGQRLVFLIDGLDEGTRDGPGRVLKPMYFSASEDRVCYILSFRTGTISPVKDLGISGAEPLSLAGLTAADVQEPLV